MCENTQKYNIFKKVRKSVAFATKSYPHKLTSYPHSYPHIHTYPHNIASNTITRSIQNYIQIPVTQHAQNHV